MARSRSYNPGRDTRWGTARWSPPTHRVVRLGSAQIEANEQTIKQTGKPLPWKRYHTPLESMDSLQTGQVTYLLDQYPTCNQTRDEGGGTWWYLRSPAGFLDDQPGLDELPANTERSR